MRHDHGVIIRDATQVDALACAAIYAPYVVQTAISFEDEPPSAAMMGERIAAAGRRHAWLVAEHDETVVGYAYAGPVNPRAAYRWSCEVSVYVDRAHHGRGVGRSLYAALFDRLRERGYRTALAGVAVPNPASENLHRTMGFDEVARYRRIGFKLGRWHDVAWLQLFLTPQDDLSAPGQPPGGP